MAIRSFCVVVALLIISSISPTARAEEFQGPSFRKGLWHFVRTLDSLITVFHQGAILLEGHAEKVLTDPSVREVYLGNRA